jgi:hypothetical protein
VDVRPNWKEQPVMPTKPGRTGSDETDRMTCNVSGSRRAYAVAIRDGNDLFLHSIVRRSRKGDVYFHYAHEQFGPRWKGHASYHCSGQHHHKSFGQKALVRQCQRPDANFRGVANVITTNVSAGDARAIYVPCDPTRFDDLFEIADSDLRSTCFQLSVDLTSGEPIPPPNTKSNLVQQHEFNEFFPHIVVTLFD